MRGQPITRPRSARTAQRVAREFGGPGKTVHPADGYLQCLSPVRNLSHKGSMANDVVAGVFHLSATTGRLRVYEGPKRRRFGPSRRSCAAESDAACESGFPVSRPIRRIRPAQPQAYCFRGRNRTKLSGCFHKLVCACGPVPAAGFQSIPANCRNAA